MTYRYTSWDSVGRKDCYECTFVDSIRRRLSEFRQELWVLTYGLEAWRYHMLQQEYEHQCSDEAINELAEANGYLFFRDGRLIPRELYPKK